MINDSKYGLQSKWVLILNQSGELLLNILRSTFNSQSSWIIYSPNIKIFTRRIINDSKYSLQSKWVLNQSGE